MSRKFAAFKPNRLCHDGEPCKASPRLRRGVPRIEHRRTHATRRPRHGVRSAVLPGLRPPALRELVSSAPRGPVASKDA